MVAGSVIAPRLDLTNEDLVRSHVHAIWLAETDQSMKSSITDLLEAGGDTPSLRPAPRPLARRDRARRGAPRRSAAPSGCSPSCAARGPLDGGDPAWWSDGWVARPGQPAPPQAFDEAFDRWRELYRTALAEYHEQHKLAISTTASASGTGGRPSVAAPRPATS